MWYVLKEEGNILEFLGECMEINLEGRFSDKLLGLSEKMILLLGWNIPLHNFPVDEIVEEGCEQFSRIELQGPVIEGGKVDKLCQLAIVLVAFE